MDGLNIRIERGIIDKYFVRDKYGLVIPNSQYLQMDAVRADIEKQNKADTGYYRRVSEIVYRADVETANNPYGNSPTLGAGLKMFGPRPYDGRKFGERFTSETTEGARRSLEKREAKILQNQLEIEGLYKSLKPDSSASPAMQALYLQEGYQVMTGGGFDGNKLGEVTKSGLNFVVRGSKPFDIKDSEISKIVVEGCLWMKEHLKQWGLAEGSLKPMGATEVRLAQESDGMLGWPVYAKALSPLTPQIAVRLMLLSGVDTRPYVGMTVIDKRTGERVKYRVVDALAWILDHSTIAANSWRSIVTLLVRIQKHGWKKEKGETVAKDGKTRSIYPNAALPGIIEAMTIAPFNDKLKEVKALFMPSLQDKPTRVNMIWDVLTSGLSEGYEYLPADWSKYDATVKGSILATVVDLVVKPFFNAEYQHWVEYVAYAITYKYIMMDSRLCAINNDLYSEALTAAPNVKVGNFTVFGLLNGLISGLKFTHVGGSIYGMVTIHYGIASLLGYKPRDGFQGGDDTLVAYPKDRVDLASAENTYAPISKAASAFDLDLNASKQDWWVFLNEVGKVFLQDTFHIGAEVKGIGSIFRPYDAVFFSERNKNLTPPEQLMAEIARMNQGADSPFAPMVVEHWLQREEAIGVLFKAQGENAFDTIVESIGLSTDEIAKKIGVGSYTYGVSRGDLERGTLAILPVIAAVSAKMDFKLSPDKVAKWLGGPVLNDKSADDSPDPEEIDDLD